MKKQITFIGIFSVVILFLFNSCSSSGGNNTAENNPTPESPSGNTTSVLQPTASPVSSLKYIDSNVDGTIDATYKRTHDSQGHVTHSEYDSDNDGVIDHVYEYTYDSSGNILTKTKDSSNDGDIDESETHTYDSHGNPLESVYTDGDSVSTYGYTYTYDENDRVIHEKIILDGNWYSESSVPTYSQNSANGYYYLVGKMYDNLEASSFTYIINYYNSAEYSPESLVIACWAQTSDVEMECEIQEHTSYGDYEKITLIEVPLTTEITEQSLITLTADFETLKATATSINEYSYANEYDSFGNPVVTTEVDEGENNFDSITTFVNTYADGTITKATDADADGFPQVTDCDDSSSILTAKTEESCDGLDNDCDGSVDEDIDVDTYYKDSDSDGYGDENAAVEACTKPEGYASNDNDCDDTDSAVTSASKKSYCLDNDGDGYGDGNTVTVACAQPAGYITCSSSAFYDCDDTDASVDWMDESEEYYQDNDSDGYGNPAQTKTACATPEGYVSNSNDCDDTSPSVTTAGDTLWYTDADGDGYGSSTAAAQSGCTAPSGTVASNSDCNDDNENIRPGKRDCHLDSAADESIFTGKYGVDDDCDGSKDEGSGAICTHIGPHHF